MTQRAQVRPGGSRDNGHVQAALPGPMPATDSSRLWRPLSYRPPRPRELKELDRYGEDFLGTIHRAIRWRSRLRTAAEEVVRRSDAMHQLGERAFDAEIETAREDARCGRRDTAARLHAFAVVREAVRRTIGLHLYVEQVMGGWVMEDGGLAEMATGEGKTVTACLTAAVQGWMGYGVHVVTVNDYLARRDAELNGPVYKRLGLTVGVIQHESGPEDRRAAYACDITYTTDQQLIFDFLRDRLHSPLHPRVSSLLLHELTENTQCGAWASSPCEKTQTQHDPLPGTNSPSRPEHGLPDRNSLASHGLEAHAPSQWTERIVQRGLYAAIIDEADSVLVDQATTPAIIGTEGQEDPSAGYYRTAAEIARTLQPNEHYTVDHKQHRVDLTERGKERLGELADRLPPFWSGPRRRAEIVTLALTAQELFRNEDHYIVRDDDIHIVDPQTGRVLEGRQWQLGLHQAMQAKEGLKVTTGRETMARISYQRFFQQYRRLAGMTGTAWEVRRELWSTFHLPVVRIPTHKPMIRRHTPDRVFATRDEKFAHVAQRVEELHRRGRPVLLGTRSVEASELMDRLLTERGIPHRVLNAVRHEEEAAIVAGAGLHGAVTVATNMAGRGTDILLGVGVVELGGLVVIATERHDSRRIDRQLFGRAGRQGDPGQAEVYVSLDDPLIRANGIKPLAAFLARRTRRWWTRPLTWFLWWHAQRAASRRQQMARQLISKSDLWLDRAIYYENR